jgi:hypothetical protein
MYEQENYYYDFWLRYYRFPERLNSVANWKKDESLF